MIHIKIFQTSLGPLIFRWLKAYYTSPASSADEVGFITGANNSIYFVPNTSISD